MPKSKRNTKRSPKSFAVSHRRVRKDMSEKPTYHPSIENSEIPIFLTKRNIFKEQDKDIKQLKGK